MAGRDLGDLGEIEVIRWARQRDIVPNKVQCDKKGWDIFLEFPHAEPETKKYFLDIRPPELSCLVQVKATDKRVGKIPHIKLTNWERMAKSPLPCFFVVLEYAKKIIHNGHILYMSANTGLEKFWRGSGAWKPIRANFCIDVVWSLHTLKLT